MKQPDVKQLTDEIAELTRKGNTADFLAAANAARDAWAAVLEGALRGDRCVQRDVDKLRDALQRLHQKLRRGSVDNRSRAASKRVGAYIQFLAAINAGGLEGATKAVGRASMRTQQRRSRRGSGSAVQVRGGSKRKILHSS